MGDDTAGPHLGNQLIVGNYPLVMLREIAQYVHDLGLQAHAFASGAHLLARGIYLHLAQSKRDPEGFVVFVRHGSILSVLCCPFVIIRSVPPVCAVRCVYPVAMTVALIAIIERPARPPNGILLRRSNQAITLHSLPLTGPARKFFHCTSAL